MIRRARWAALGLALAAPACGGGEGAPEPVAEAAAPIAGGYDDATDKAVVGFFFVAAGGLCSGSLIAPNVVLTARHCVSAIENEVGGGVVCSKTTAGPPGSPVGFFVTTSSPITPANAGEYLTAEVVLLPVDSDLLCGNDLAILVLKSNVDAAIPPLVPRIDAPLAPGDVYSAIGYGAIDDAGGASGTRRRRDDLVVDCVAGGCPATYVMPTDWGGETGVGPGDSGGPAIDAEGRVAGVTSRGAANCDTPVYGDVYSWRQWLKDTVAYASGLGEYAPPAWTEGTTVDPEHSAPVGGECASDADCFTGRCVTDADTPYCTRSCSADAACPEGYDCIEGAPSICKQPAPANPKPPPALREDDGGCSVSAPGGGRGGGGAGAASVAGAAIAWLVAARRRRRAPTSAS